MNMYLQRRLIAVAALIGFLFAIAFPALAVARQAIDPLAYAKICRIDTGTAAGERSTGPSGPLQGKLKSAHCVLCVGTATPPPVIVIAPVVVAAAAERAVPVDRGRDVAHDRAVLQPLHPRAPPRV